MEQNNEINKKDKSKIIILILSCAILALVAALTILSFKYKELSTKSNNNGNNTVNNTENKDDNSNSENNNDTGNTENENNSSDYEQIKEVYEFVDIKCEANYKEGIEKEPGIIEVKRKSGLNTMFVPSKYSLISERSLFGEFKVREDGKVELITDLDIPSYIATKEKNKYVMNLDNVKSVVSTTLGYQQGNVGVVFVHKDGTISILFVEGGVYAHITFLLKNIKGINNIDYVAYVDSEKEFNWGVDTYYTTYAFDKKGNAYGIADDFIFDCLQDYPDVE